MSNKHASTLAAIFADPVRGRIPWKSIDTMLLAYGAEITEGRGLRVRVALNGVRALFHRPDPRKEAVRGAVRPVRRFLSEAGIQP